MMDSIAGVITCDNTLSLSFRSYPLLLVVSSVFFFKLILIHSTYCCWYGKQKPSNYHHSKIRGWFKGIYGALEWLADLLPNLVIGLIEKDKCERKKQGGLDRTIGKCPSSYVKQMYSFTVNLSYTLYNSFWYYEPDNWPRYITIFS